MKINTLLYASLLVSGIATALLGCDDDEGRDYEATVIWQIGDTPTCSSPPISSQNNLMVNFDQIEITVYRNEKDAQNENAEAVQEGIKVSCATGQYEIKNLRRGSYWVVLQARATVDGQTLPYYIGGEKLTVPTEVPRSVYGKISWNF